MTPKIKSLSIIQHIAHILVLACHAFYVPFIALYRVLRTHHSSFITHRSLRLVHRSPHSASRTHHSSLITHHYFLFLFFLLLHSPFSILHSQQWDSPAMADSLDIREKRATGKLQTTIDRWLITDFAHTGILANTLVKTSPFLQYPAMNPELGAYLSGFEKETDASIILRAYIDVDFFNPWVATFKGSQKLRKMHELSRAKSAHAMLDIVYTPTAIDRYDVKGYNISLRDSLRTPAFQNIFNDADWKRMRDTLQAAMGRGPVQKIDSAGFNAAIIRALEALKGDPKLKPDPGYQVVFRKAEAGYDAYRWPALRKYYHTNKAGDPVAWIAVNAKAPVTLHGSYSVADPEAAGETPLKIEAGDLMAGTPEIKDTTVTLTLNPAGKAEEINIQANYVRTNRFGKGIEAEAGQIAMAAYEQQERKLVVISPQPVEAMALQNELNKIYQQALVKWTVTIDTDDFNHNWPAELTTSNTTLSKYSSEMNAAIKAYKKKRKIDNKTSYIFIVSGIAGNVSGYMPLTGQWGFVLNSNNLAHTIAHELGHGPFHLRHTFSEKDFIAAQGTTDNLMDYTANKATKLYKHQWDMVHDPETMLFAWAEDEEEGEIAIVKNTEVLDNFKNADGTYTFLSLSGKPVTLPKRPSSVVFSTGETFKLNKCENQIFRITPFGVLVRFSLEENGAENEYSAYAVCNENKFTRYATDDGITYKDALTNTLINKAIVGFPYVENGEIIFRIGQAQIPPIDKQDNGLSYAGSVVTYDYFASKIGSITNYKTVYAELYPKYDTEVKNFIVSSLSSKGFDGNSFYENAGYVFIHATQLQENEILKGCFKTGIPGALLDLMMETIYITHPTSAGSISQQITGRIFSDFHEMTPEEKISEAKSLIHNWKKYNINYYDIISKKVKDFSIPENASADGIYKLLLPYASNISTDNWDCFLDQINLDNKIRCIELLLKNNSGFDNTEEIIANLILSLTKEEDIKTLFEYLQANNYALFGDVWKSMTSKWDVVTDADKSVRLKLIYKLAEWRLRYYSPEGGDKYYALNTLIDLTSKNKFAIFNSGLIEDALFNYLDAEIDATNAIAIKSANVSMSNFKSVYFKNLADCNWTGTPFDWVVLYVTEDIPAYGLAAKSLLTVPAFFILGVDTDRDNTQNAVAVRLVADVLAIAAAPFTAGGSTIIFTIETVAATVDIAILLHQDLANASLGEPDVTISAWNAAYTIWNLSLTARWIGSWFKFKTVPPINNAPTRLTGFQIITNKAFELSEEMLQMGNPEKLKFISAINEFVDYLKAGIASNKVPNIVEANEAVSRFIEMKLKIENSIRTTIPIAVDGKYLVVQKLSIAEITTNKGIISLSNPRWLPQTATNIETVTTLKNLTIAGKTGQTAEIVLSRGQAYLKEMQSVSRPNLMKLSGKASSVSISWKNIDETNIIWVNPNSNILSTAKSFVGEKGTAMYDVVLSNGYYVKFDISDGRILLGNTNGAYHAFAVIEDDILASFKISVLNVSDDIFNATLLQFLTTNADKLKTLSGTVIKPLTIGGKSITVNSKKVNTILGRYMPDISNLFDELGSFKNVGLGETKGGLNILNKPNHYYDEVAWWSAHNRPWLDRAIARGDDIYLATIPDRANTLIDVSGKLKGAYAQEIDHLATRNYKPVNITEDLWCDILYWFGKPYIKNGAKIDAISLNEAYKHINDIELDKMGRPSYSRSGGMVGNHNEVNFQKQLVENGGRIEIINKGPSVSGFTLIEYRVLQLDPAGNVLQGKYYSNGDIYFKSVYDPKIWPENELKNIGYKGFIDAINKNNFIEKSRTFSGEVNGIQVVGHYIEVNGEKILKTWWLE